MNEFLQIAFSFPTLVWTVLLALAVLYWLLAATGIVGHDHVHVDGADAHGFDIHDVHSGGHADGHHHQDTNESVGMMHRLGLTGVPLMVTLALLTFWGWILTYFVHLLILSKLPDATRPLLGLLVMLGALIPALLLTNVFLRPIRPIFKKLNGEEPRSVIGLVGTVTTPYVDDRYGMASIEDGGAGLLLQVRSSKPGVKLQRGQRVVLLERNLTDNSYFVTSEDQFNA